MNNTDIAKAYIKAVQTGDQAALGSLISPDVVWHQPGSNRFSGRHEGMGTVGPMLGKMMEVSKGTFAISRADHYMANGDWVDLLRIKDGKVIEVRLFSSDPAQEDAFWGQ